MECKAYKGMECLNSGANLSTNIDYCCTDCLMHVAVEHDKMLEQNYKNHITKIDTLTLTELLEQYKWETECNLDRHNDKITLIEKELEGRNLNEK